jgi:hypothetical protein
VHCHCWGRGLRWSQEAPSEKWHSSQARQPGVQGKKVCCKTFKLVQKAGVEGRAVGVQRSLGQARAPQSFIRQLSLSWGSECPGIPQFWAWSRCGRCESLLCERRGVWLREVTLGMGLGGLTLACEGLSVRRGKGRRLGHGGPRGREGAFRVQCL